MGVLSIDQVRVFLSISETGSFGKAARALHRHQSAISYAVANLEAQLGVTLFDRSDRRSRLTPAGEALLVDARKVTFGLDALRSRAKSFSLGIEPELVVAIDSFCPMAPLEGALKDFAAEFPMVKLLLRLEVVAVAVEQVLQGHAMLGIISHPMSTREELRQVPLEITMEIAAYACAEHPLSRVRGRVDDSLLVEHLQLLLTDECGLNKGMKFAARVWHTNDFRTMHTMLRAGAGWAFMPTALVADDVDAGRLVTLDLAAWPASGLAKMQMMGVHQADVHLGPAATWLLNRLSTPN